MAPTPEILRVDIVKETTRLQNTDGIFPNRVDDQFSSRFVDPITGHNSFNAERSLPTGDVREAANLRMAQSAFIRVSGFDNRVDPETNKPLDLKTPEGFQKFYELSRKHVVSESAKMKANLKAEGMFIPEGDPITKLPLEDDSLKLFWILKNQLTDNYVSQTDYQNWQTSFQQLVQQYGSAIDMGNVITYSENNFYRNPLKSLLPNILVIERNEVISGVNTLLARGNLRIPDRQGQTELKVSEKLQMIPGLIEQSIASYESRGIYVPNKNPDSETGEYPTPLSKLILAIDIAEGKRPEILQRRQQELVEQARQEEQSRQEVNAKKQDQREEQRLQIAQRRASEALKLSETMPEIKEAKFGLRKRFKESVLDVTKADVVFDLYKRAELVPKNILLAVYHYAKGDFDQYIDNVTQKEEEKIKGYGLDPGVMFRRWSKGSLRSVRGDSLLFRATGVSYLAPFILGSWSGENQQRNMRKMDVLERKRPGITKILFEEFGIANYSRYPIEFLVKQYDQRNDQTLPYGVMLNAVEDWNGVGLVHNGWMKVLLRKSSNKCNIRIVEAENKIDLARAMLKFRKRYSKKISFGIVGAHGEESAMHFGGRGDLNKLYSRDLLGEGVKNALTFFEPNATIILSSCSAGANGGIAQKLSEVGGLTVIAPDRPTRGPTSIKLKIRKDGSVFVDFNFGGIIPFKNIKRIYQGGKRIDKIAA